MNVVAVTLYCSGSVVVLGTSPYELYRVNRQRTAALGAIEGDEPSLTAAAATSHIEVTLVNNTEGCAILGFSKQTILQQK